MAYKESEYLQVSGIQHYLFCRRQWALIHIENQWAENVLTVSGNILHETAHSAERPTKRGDVIITYSMPVFSPTLGVSGMCDVVEFQKDPNGTVINGFDGRFVPYPIEYKRGSPKENSSDIFQLCTQALCLEQMLCCDIPKGALYYGETRRRLEVVFTDELRNRVTDTLKEMHDLYKRGYTPKVKPTKACRSCSLQELCLPQLMRTTSVKTYIENSLKEIP